MLRLTLNICSFYFIISMEKFFFGFYDIVNKYLQTTLHINFMYKLKHKTTCMLITLNNSFVVRFPHASEIELTSVSSLCVLQELRLALQKACPHKSQLKIP